MGENEISFPFGILKLQDIHKSLKEIGHFYNHASLNLLLDSFIQKYVL